MKKAGELLNSFFDGNVLKQAKGYSEFFGGWRSIVGDQIGAHSRVLELEQNVLVVEADHPGWIQLIQLKQADILRTVQSKYPDFHITAISIRLQRNGGAAEEQRREPRPPRQPSEVERHDREPSPAGSDPYAAIGDEDFKDKLRRLELSIRARNEADGEGSR